MQPWKTVFQADLRQFDSVEVVYEGDLHIGQKAFCEPIVRLYHHWILDKPNRFVVLMGDMLEIAIKKKMAMGQVLKPVQQKRIFKRLFKPLADEGRILLFIGGNHEKRISDTTEDDLVEDLADKIGVENYATMEAWLNLRVGGQRYYNYNHHGWGGSKKAIFALEHLIYRSGICNDADLVAIAHLHESFCETFPIVKIRRGKPVIKEIHGIRTGSALGYADYAKEKAYTPKPLGFPVVRYGGRERTIDTAKHLFSRNWRH